MNEDDVESFLEHHGVKGMKWGVVNKDKLSGSDSSSKKNASDDEKLIKTAVDTSSKAQQAASLSENKKKFASKFEGDGSKKEKSPTSKPKFHLTEDEVVVGVLGAAFVGLVVYSHFENKKFIASLPKSGEKVTPSAFNKAIAFSQVKSWTTPGGMGYLKGPSLKQEEMLLPAGHTFHRLTTSAEQGFRHATYSVPSTEDFNRYVAGFRGELGGKASQLHHVQFTSKEPIRIPSLTKSIDTMREVLKEEGHGMDVPRIDAIKTFTNLSGGGWEGSTAGAFMAKLKDQGYHGVVDHMDAGVIGDRPLVLFKPEAFTEKVVSRMSEVDIRNAESNLLELTARKL